MKLRVGQTLHSAVDSTTVVVIRAPDADVSVTCGDAEMLTSAPVTASPPSSAGGEGAQLGKRYVDAAETVELLCTKAGASALAVDGAPVSLKEAKPLPASD